MTSKTKPAPGLANPAPVKSVNHDKTQAYNEPQTDLDAPATPGAAGYWVLSPDLVKPCSSALLAFLAAIVDEFGCKSGSDGSTVITIRYWNRDVSKHISDRTGYGARTVDDRLADLRKLPGVRMEYGEDGHALAIRLPAANGKRRPQVPKRAGLSGRALRVWLALQLSDKRASTRQVAERLDCSHDTISRGEAELEKTGFLCRVKSKGTVSYRVLVGKVESIGNHPQEPPEPHANTALFRLPKQLDKGPAGLGQRSTAPERIPGHTPRTSISNRPDLLADDERERCEEDPSTPSPTSNERGLANARANLGRRGSS